MGRGWASKGRESVCQWHGGDEVGWGQSWVQNLESPLPNAVPLDKITSPSNLIGETWYPIVFKVTIFSYVLFFCELVHSFLGWVILTFFGMIFESTPVLNKETDYYDSL